MKNILINVCILRDSFHVLGFPQLGLIVGRKIFPCGVYPSHVSATWPWYPSTLATRTQNLSIYRDHPSIMERGPSVMWSLRPSLHLLLYFWRLTNSIPPGLLKQIHHPWFLSTSVSIIIINIILNEMFLISTRTQQVAAGWRWIEKNY